MSTVDNKVKFGVALLTKILICLASSQDTYKHGAGSTIHGRIGGRAHSLCHFMDSEWQKSNK